MKNIIYTLMFVGIAVVSVSCCAACRKSKSATMADSHWLLTEINGKAVDRTSGANAVINYSLHLAADNKYNGMGDCNRFFGAYSIDTGERTISFDHGAGVTRKMCANQAMEDEYLKILIDAKSYDMDGNYLMLKDAEGGVTATFRRVIES